MVSAGYVFIFDFGDAVAVMVFVFLVLLITDILGLTNVYPFVRHLQR